jgi:hypothetical protein
MIVPKGKTFTSPVDSAVRYQTSCTIGAESIGAREIKRRLSRIQLDILNDIFRPATKQTPRLLVLPRWLADAVTETIGA